LLQEGPEQIAEADAKWGGGSMGTGLCSRCDHPLDSHFWDGDHPVTSCVRCEADPQRGALCR